MGILVLFFFVFVLAAFLGRELISKVPSQLHTPLMSATNAISGISVVGALSICAIQLTGTPGMVLCFAAIILATINVVGGYMVTERMLGMFSVSNKGAASKEAANKKGEDKG